MLGSNPLHSNDFRLLHCRAASLPLTLPLCIAFGLAHLEGPKSKLHACIKHLEKICSICRGHLTHIKTAPPKTEVTLHYKIRCIRVLVGVNTRQNLTSFFPLRLQVPPWAELSHTLGGILQICKVLPAHPFLSWKIHT